MNSLVNWDHEVNPTPWSDVVYNLVHALSELGIRPIPEGNSLNFYTVQGYALGGWVPGPKRVISLAPFGESLLFEQYDSREAISFLKEEFYAAMAA